MNRFQVLTTVSCLALIGAISTPTARADEWNKKTVITFSGPVEIPGVHLTGWGVLPAGTYVFKLLDSQSDRHIVQIFNKDETKVLATILAIPNYRLKATDKTVITFRERPAGEPEALRAWFYPGRNYGDEFVYPKAKAVELAKNRKHSGPLHAGRGSRRSCRTDPIAGPSCRSDPEERSGHGHPAFRTGSGTGSGGDASASPERSRHGRAGIAPAHREPVAADGTARAACAWRRLPWLSV